MSNKYLKFKVVLSNSLDLTIYYYYLILKNMLILVKM